MNKAIVLICLIISQAAWGYSDFYKDSKRGWFWFEEGPQGPALQGPALQGPAFQRRAFGRQTDNELDIDPLTKLQDFQEEIEQAKAAMIMTPSATNASKYIKLQNEMFKKASKVGKTWQAAMLSDPDIDIMKDSPISKRGSDIARDTKAKADTKKLFHFAKEFRLLFFYKGDCEFCGPFADVLEAFSTRYGFKVASITLDGKSLKKFPAITNQELVDKFNIRATPSVFAYSEKAGIAIPLVYGYTSLDLLEQSTVFMIDEIL